MTFWYKPPPCKLLIRLHVREDKSRLSRKYVLASFAPICVVRMYDLSSRSPINSLQGGRFVLKFVAI